MPIPYIFIWTPKYKVFANVLKKGLAEYPELEDKSIFLPQEFFDANSNKSAGHLMSGCSLKLQTAYEMLNTLPEGSYFIFSDADVISVLITLIRYHAIAGDVIKVLKLEIAV